MNNVIDEVLASSPRYNIYDENGNLVYANAQIDLSTQVTTEGTPLNKALFDSIRDDLNTRLLISSKATQSEAQQGTNNTHYSTPLRVKEQLQYLTKSGSIVGTGSSTPQTKTFFEKSQVPANVQRAIITGAFYGGGYRYRVSSFSINGTGLSAIEIYTPLSSSSTALDFQTKTGTSLGDDFFEQNPQPFKIEIDFATNTFSYEYEFSNYSGSAHYLRRYKKGNGSFSTLSNISAILYGNSDLGNPASRVEYTITYLY